MADNLLKIVQDVVKEIGTFEIPGTIVGNANALAVQLLALANSAIKEIEDRHDWSYVNREHSFTTVASQEEYALPTDYKETVNLTWWDRNRRFSVRGPATARQWQQLKGSNVTATTRKWFRIKQGTDANRADKIFLFPLPDNSTDNIVFEYNSDAFVFDSTGPTITEEFLKDTDTPLFPSRLVKLHVKWNLLQAEGLPYAEELRQYEEALHKARAADGGNQLVDFVSGDLRVLHPNVPEGGFG